jgi:hypothetical protein
MFERVIDLPNIIVDETNTLIILNNKHMFEVYKKTDSNKKLVCICRSEQEAFGYLGEEKVIAKQVSNQSNRLNKIFNKHKLF